MDSNALGESVITAPHLRAPRSILLLAVAYDLLLAAIAVALLAQEAADIFTALTFAVVPAIIYSLGVFRYGGILFAGASPPQRVHAWRSLVLFSAILFIATLAVIQVWTFPGESNETIYGIRGSIWWTAVAMLDIGLIALWAYLSWRACLPASHTPAPRTKWIPALLAGSALVLASVVLDVNYTTHGWQLLSWQQDWPTLYFTEPSAAVLPLKALCLAGYAAGVVLAVLSVWAAHRIVLNRPPTPKTIRRLLDLSVVVFWFTLTNYLCTDLMAVTIGVFLFTPRPLLFALIVAGWLGMFVAGMVLWFRFSVKDRGATAQTLLLLWALPLVPSTLSRLADAVGFFLYGLIAFVVGVLVLSACWYKLAETSTQQTASSLPSPP